MFNKKQPYLLFFILVHSQKTVQLFVYQNTQSYLLLPTLLITSETTILSIHIFTSSQTSSLLEEEPLCIDIFLLFFLSFFFFVAINDHKPHKPTPDLHKLTSTTKINKTTTRSIFLKSDKHFFCVQVFFYRKI